MVPRLYELKLCREMGTHPERVNAMFGLGTLTSPKIRSRGLHGPNGAFLQENLKKTGHP